MFVLKQFIRHRKTKLQTAIIKPGLNTLGDNLQQHVAVTCHSDKVLCVYWQNVCENLCLCNGNLWKNKLQKSSDLLLQIVAHFLTSPAHKEWLVAAMRLHWHVAWCVPALINSKFCCLLMCHDWSFLWLVTTLSPFLHRVCKHFWCFRFTQWVCK